MNKLTISASYYIKRLDITNKGGINLKDYLGISKVMGMEVLDSRGNPTVQVEVITEGGFSGIAMVPSRCFYGKL